MFGAPEHLICEGRGSRPGYLRPAAAERQRARRANPQLNPASGAALRRLAQRARRTR